MLVITFYQTGPDGLFYFSKVFNLILQSAIGLIKKINPNSLLVIALGIIIVINTMKTLYCIGIE